MDFLEQNYLWFVVGGIILVMIIIGYIAEKTDFGHKKVEKKKENKIARVKQDEIKNLDNVKLADAVYKESSKENIENPETIVLEPMDNGESLEIIEPSKTELSKEELDALSVPIESTLANEKKEEEIPSIPPVAELENTDNNVRDEVWKDKPIEETKEEEIHEDDIWKF